MAERKKARTAVLGEAPALPGAQVRGLPALYYQLADVFRRRIEDGEWPVEAQIPTLDELVAEFGAARSTVREALTILEREGLLARYRGRGTFVLKKPDREPELTIDTNWLSLVGLRAKVKRELLNAEVVEKPLHRSHLGGTLARDYGYFVRRHSLEGTPYVIRSGYLEGRLWRRLTKEQIANAAMVRTLLDMPDVILARCEQTITVAAADFEIAGLLRVPLNSPIAVVDRSVFDPKNLLVLESRGYYRGDFVRIEMTLK